MSKWGTSFSIALFGGIAVLHLTRAVMGWDVTFNHIHIPPVASFGIAAVTGGLAWLLWKENIVKVVTRPEEGCSLPP